MFRCLVDVGLGSHGLSLEAAMQSDATWKRRRNSFGLASGAVNVGLALMIILDLFPGGSNSALGIPSANGYWHARPPDISWMGGRLPQAGMAAHGGGYGPSSLPAPCPSPRRVAQYMEKRSLCLNKAS